MHYRDETNFRIYEASPKAKALVPAGTVGNMLKEDSNENAYPFQRLHVGFCFLVNYTKEDRKTIENRVRKAVSHNNKKFVDKAKWVCINHREQNLFEVARIR